MDAMNALRVKSSMAGRVVCLRCYHEFFSRDHSRIRICNRCKNDKKERFGLIAETACTVHGIDSYDVEGFYESSSSAAAFQVEGHPSPGGGDAVIAVKSGRPAGSMSKSAKSTKLPAIRTLKTPKSPKPPTDDYDPKEIKAALRRARSQVWD